MEKRISIQKLLNELPLDFMREKAAEMKVDFKAKKLDSMRFFALLLIGFLRNTTISQRLVSEQAESTWIDEFLKMDISPVKVCHSSISDRLSTISPEYFKCIYDCLLGQAEGVIWREDLEASNIVRIDTTLVAETANKLKEGINTGVNKRFGGAKRHIKYGMAYDGFSSIMEKIFTEQKASSEEIALSQTILDTIRMDKERGRIYVFDRGTTSYKSLCDINALCLEKKCYFVSRLKLSRKYHCKESMLARDTKLSDSEFEILEDQRATLNIPQGLNYPEVQFRIIRVRFIKPRPRTLPSDKRRKYEPEMLIISNDFESEALDVVNDYRQRWSVEVFYKFLKQNLSFSHLLSTNKNGIEVMMYMTLIVGVLLKLYGALNNLGPTIAKERLIVQLENWLYESGRNHQPECQKAKIITHIRSSDR